ncbi:MAG: site-specific DNA-methyltransferase [Candidatus Heimdallarchaeum endolithica]|uniref:Type II methyltransferase n=1 Tax=Candidatus Heimdallarchaeum endolithica TaxID=2876572 RepID=A0A9Y1BRM4_9ARCH|nr:MAG: site-specific DNA-methyltransferase [Candidatus Heimdallarchaeum endolithica]
MEKRHTENKLNELSGKEWIKFTKSWFIHRPKSRGDKKILHPASFPESLVIEFIYFFTKKGQWVLDPFLGTGSTLLACRESRRNGVGIEINKKYAKIAKSRLNENPEITEFIDKEKTSSQIVIQGDSRKLKKLLESKDIKEIDFCITSPPYWNQLKRNNIRQKKRKENNLDTVYSTDNERDIGNIDDYNKFIEEQKQIFDQVYEVMKDGGYLVIITNNVFFNGKLYPLAFDTAISLSNPEKGGQWILKDEKIWCQDDKALLPLGIYNAWVGNRHHQYCLIFRKEKLLT